MLRNKHGIVEERAAIPGFSPPERPCTGGLLIRRGALNTTDVMREVVMNFCDRGMPI